MILKVLSIWRSRFMRFLLKRDREYSLLPEPVSDKYGFDRGTPVERYYIDSFLTAHKDLIRGTILEVESPNYASRFASGKEVTIEIVDYNKNPKATYIADLSNIGSIPKDHFDTILLTQVIGAVPDYMSMLQNCHNALKSGGQMLITTSALATMISPPQDPLWRFTPKGLGYICKKIFGEKNVKIFSYGNFTSASASLMGLGAQELNAKELDKIDVRFPVLSCTICQKS